MRIFFDLPVIELTDAILSKAIIKDPYKYPRRLDGKHVLVAFDSNNIPTELFKAGHAPLTLSEANQLELTAEWDKSENAPALVSNTRGVDDFGNPVFTPAAFADESNLNFDGNGKYQQIPADETTNIDYKIINTAHFNGLRIMLGGHVQGDKATLQVVDVDGIMAPAGTVLNQFAKDWFFSADTSDQGREILPYKSTIPAGLYIRIKYTATGLVLPVKVWINYYLHKII